MNFFSKKLSIKPIEISIKPIKISTEPIEISRKSLKKYRKTLYIKDFQYTMQQFCNKSTKKRMELAILHSLFIAGTCSLHPRYKPILTTNL